MDFNLARPQVWKVVHRDVKLENILLNSNGYPLIADMGLAKIVARKTYTICGTDDYFAPEVLSRKRPGYNQTVDWYALGVVIYVMMFGRSPFEAPEKIQIYANIKKGFEASHFEEDHDPSLKDVILQLSHKTPDQRLQMSAEGPQNLQEHAWFHNFQWGEMSMHSLRAPWMPPCKKSRGIPS